MKTTNQFALLMQRRFAPFFWTQFLGALNDNVFKTSLITILTFDAVSWTTMSTGLLNNLIPVLFILPFMLFSASAGQIGDKFDKAGLARMVKLIELLIMSVAALGWFERQVWLLIAGVAGMGLHSTLFGPIKYAYLPQHLESSELIGGNALVEMGTFVGILLGQILGASLIMQPGWGIHLVASVSIGLALLGGLASLMIPSSPAPVPALRINWNPFSEMVRNVQFSRKNRIVFIGMLGNSWFWFYGAIILAQIPHFAKVNLNGDYSVFILLLATFSVGVGAGSLMCERLSGHKVEIGLVPISWVGMTLFGAGLYWTGDAFHSDVALDMAGFIHHPYGLAMLGMVLGIGITAGLYVVPLFALIQTRCDPSHISRTIAGMNILNSMFMVISGILAIVLLSLNLSLPQLFLVTSILNIGAGWYLFAAAPEFLTRCAAWWLVHTSYRVTTVNMHAIPENGAALLYCHAADRRDLMALSTCTARQIRFVVDQRTLSGAPWWLGKTGAIVRRADELPALALAINMALQQGELVCLVATNDDTHDQLLQSAIGAAQGLAAPVVVLARRGSDKPEWIAESQTGHTSLALLDQRVQLLVAG